MAMTFNNTARFPVALALIVILLSSWGCGKVLSIDPEVNLRNNVNKYMQALIDFDWDTVYELRDKAWKERTNKREYIQAPVRVPYKRYEIESITIHPDGKRADVVVEVDFIAMGFPFKNVTERQIWVKEDRLWRKLIRKSSMNMLGLPGSNKKKENTDQ